MSDLREFPIEPWHSPVTRDSIGVVCHANESAEPRLSLPPVVQAKRRAKCGPRRLSRHEREDIRNGRAVWDPTPAALARVAALCDRIEARVRAGTLLETGDAAQAPRRADEDHR